MNFKRVIMILNVVTIVLIISLLGFSYTWYVASNVSTKININTPNSNIIKTDFATTEYINNTIGVPILASEVATKADKNIFTIIAQETMTKKADYNIYIDEIVMDDALKISDFKWELLKNNTSVANGDFSSIGNNKRIDLYTTNLTLGATTPDSYELRIWLEETGENQNNLICCHIQTYNHLNTHKYMLKYQKLHLEPGCTNLEI